MNRPEGLRRFLHRRGWIASPSRAFLGVPFGPDRRDLAGEVMADIARSHDERTCPICSAPDEPRDGEDQDDDGPPAVPPRCIPDHRVPVHCPGCATH